jgi:hypothetical protein
MKRQEGLVDQRLRGLEAVDDVVAGGAVVAVAVVEENVSAVADAPT